MGRSRCADLGVHLGDLGVHDAAISVFTMRRFGRSRWSDFRKPVKNFSAIAKFPEVIGVAMTDGSGTLLECSGRMDGEVAGAVHAYAARALSQAGETLGLSTFERTTIVGATSSCVIAVYDNGILGAEVDPSKPLAAIEKKIWDTITK